MSAQVMLAFREHIFETIPVEAMQLVITYDYCYSIFLEIESASRQGFPNSYEDHVAQVSLWGLSQVGQPTYRIIPMCGQYRSCGLKTQ